MAVAAYWERKLGPFLKLVADMAGTERKFAAECWAGYDIVVVNASVVSRPGAGSATAPHPLRATPDHSSTSQRPSHR